MASCNQDQIYDFLSKLQAMTKEIPVLLQQRLPNELLSSLASSLVEGQIFEIVDMLIEVQQATEKQLFRQRLEMQRRLKDERQAFDGHYQTTIQSTDDPNQLVRLTERLKKEKEEMLARHQEETKAFDTQLVMQLDQKVLDQQTTLEKAGVPGFKITNNPTEIQIQMHLVDFIIRLNPNGKR